MLRARLLQVLYTVRSERMLIEQLVYSPLVPWFGGLSMDADVCHPTTFTKNGDSLAWPGTSRLGFLDAITTQARTAGLLFR